MFHVKLFNISNHCQALVSSIKENRETHVKIEDWSSIPLITESINNTCVVLCDDSNFDDIASSFDLLSNKNVFIPFVDKKTSTFTKTYHEEMLENSSFLISFSYNNVGLFIVNKEALHLPLFFDSPQSPFVIGKKEADSSELVSFLEKNNYQKVDAVLEPGDYAVRGGVFDIFSYGSSFPLRAGFIGGEAGVLYFNLSTGSVVKESSSAHIYPLPGKPSFSIFKKFKKNFIYIDCLKKRATIKNSRSLNSKSLTIKETISSVSYKKYIKNKSNNVVFCSFLLAGGCEFGGVFYLPSWYSSGSKKVSKEKKIPLVGSLKYGDYYVHERYGVCKYTGSITGSEDDKRGFISLKFADGRINLDVGLLNKISFFAPSESDCKLGSFNKSGPWKKKKEKAEKNAEDFISKVLSSYLKREASLVVPFKQSKELVSLFLSEFPFLDTPDQASAWEKIQKDLCCEEPMHRLLCGDVGFGKTEIAMRAVFLSFVNKKQSIVLAPTTILSQQLFFCFKNRLESFGCIVGQVSRLTKKNIKTFDLFSNNKIDVLIGTHSIIKNKNVLSKASLLIVDEEHRFGVKDKEKIIEHSPACNFLSMSATPIPRTMQLALSGVRNISTLLSPPIERRPVITNIHSFSIKTIENYLLKEFNRGGQVYFVDNSVESLKKLFLFFQDKLPNISSSFLYGGMDKNKIKKTMEDFRLKKTLFLFSTTIIESGIDVSSANTIIINNANMFGLSQLHQLRGRVGRSGIQAYACLLIPQKKKLTPDGKARLLSIKKHSSLGSGYSLSLEDLQIRGSGSLFGYKQSGESIIGFDYYSKILSKRMRLGADSYKKPEPVIDFDNAYISSSLIEDEQQRVFYYKKISDCLNIESLNSFYTETSLLFGQLPVAFNLLFKCKKLSFLAEKSCVSGIKRKAGNFTITVSSFVLKNVSGFLEKTSLYFKSKNIEYSLSSNTNFLKIKFSYIKEDSYILLKDFIKNTYV